MSQSPGKFLQISQHLLNHSKYNQRSGRSINKQVSWRAICSTLTKSCTKGSPEQIHPDQKMVHADTFLWLKDLNQEAVRPWKNHLENWWGISADFNVLISHMRQHDSAEHNVFFCCCCCFCLTSGAVLLVKWVPEVTDVTQDCLFLIKMVKYASVHIQWILILSVLRGWGHAAHGATQYEVKHSKLLQSGAFCVEHKHDFSTMTWRNVWRTRFLKTLYVITGAYYMKLSIVHNTSVLSREKLYDLWPCVMTIYFILLLWLFTLPSGDSVYYIFPSIGFVLRPWLLWQLSPEIRPAGPYWYLHSYPRHSQFLGPTYNTQIWY